MKIARRQKAKDCPSGSAGNFACLSLSFSKSKSCSDVCLSGGAKRRHLSMTSTRHGAKGNY